MTARSPRKHKTAAQRSFESRVWHRLFVDTGGVFCSLDLETKKCVLAAAIKQEYALMAYWSPSYEVSVSLYSISLFLSICFHRKTDV